MSGRRRVRREWDEEEELALTPEAMHSEFPEDMQFSDEEFLRDSGAHEAGRFQGGCPPSSGPGMRGRTGGSEKGEGGGKEGRKEGEGGGVREYGSAAFR